jgi:hypothetical protein
MTDRRDRFAVPGLRAASGASRKAGYTAPGLLRGSRPKRRRDRFAVSGLDVSVRRGTAMHINQRALAGLLGCLLVTMSPAAWAQAPPAAPPKLGSSNNTELGLVLTTGNSRSTSVGLRNLYLYRWSNAELRWEGGWLRVASREGNRFAVGSADDFEVVEPGTALDSQRLFSKLGHQRQLSKRTDWFANFDAVRDEPANILHQLVLAGGLGTTWRKTDRSGFRTAYGVTYTDENLRVTGSNRFGGYRLYYGLRAPVSTTSIFDSELTFDGSFNTSEDVRTDWLNGMSVAMNARIALKASVRMLVRNLPALELLQLQSPAGIPLGTVETPKDKVDLNFTTSLVMTF